MPDRDRRRCLILGFGSFAFAWLLVLVQFALSLIFNPTRWFDGRHYAVRMDYEGLVIWKDLTEWTTIRTQGYIFLAFGISGVLCLAIGISELARDAAAKRTLARRGFEVILPDSIPAVNAPPVSSPLITASLSAQPHLKPRPPLKRHFPSFSLRALRGSW